MTNNTYSAAQLREYLTGTYTQAQDRDTIRGHTHAGLTYGDGTEILSYIASEYDKRTMTPDQKETLPQDFTKTRFYNTITNKQSTEMLNEALNYGNQNVVDGVVGLPRQNRTDFSGFHTYKQLRDVMLEEGVWIGLIIAKMGRGKTDFSGLLTEIWIDAYREYTTSIASNIETFSANDEYFNKYEEMINWIRKGHDDDKKRLLILDEASQYLDYKTNPLEAQAIGKMLRLSRKAGASVIFIGHSPHDISPDVRNVSTSVIDKESQKKATFYDQVKNGSFSGEQMKLTGIPPTSIDYDTEEVSRFHFPDKDTLSEIVEGREVEESTDDSIKTQTEKEIESEMYWNMNQSGMSVREIADKVNKSHTYVHKLIKNHNENPNE